MIHFAFLANVTPRYVTVSTVDSALSFMIAFKSGSIIAFPVRENVHWTHLLGLRFRPFCPDHSETYLRALSIMEKPSASLQGWPMATSSAYLRKKSNYSEKRSEV